MSSKLTLYTILSLSLLVSGCNLPKKLGDIEGHYQGSISVKKTGIVVRSLLGAEMVVDSDQQLTLNLKYLDTQDKVALVFTYYGKKDIGIVVPQWGSDSIAFSGSVKGNCYQAQSDNGDVGVTLCKNGGDVSIDLIRSNSDDAISISLTQGDESTLPTQESPRSYSASELIQLAMKQNFESAIQFDQVVRAKLKTQTAYLNLLPHLNINSVLNIASGNLIGVLKAVGDLVPFLFPTRWLEAKADRYETEAQFDAWIVSKADATNVAQGLIYSVLRDEAVLSAIDQEKLAITQVRDQVKQKEKAGLMQLGSSDDIQSILNALDSGSVDLQTTIMEERASLALAAGMHGYDAITAVNPETLSAIDSIPQLDASGIKNLSLSAVLRSYELRQMNALVSASRIMSKGGFFQWLDPAGSRDGSLGINLFTSVKIGYEQTQILLDQREKLEAGLIDTVSRTAMGTNQYLKSYQLARADSDVQNRRKERHLGNLKTGVGFSMSDLTQSLQLSFQALIRMIDAQYAYYITRTGLDRLMLTGVYAGLPTDRGESSWVIHH